MLLNTNTEEILWQTNTGSTSTSTDPKNFKFVATLYSLSIIEENYSNDSNAASRDINILWTYDFDPIYHNTSIYFDLHITNDDYFVINYGGVQLSGR